MIGAVMLTALCLLIMAQGWLPILVTRPVFVWGIFLFLAVLAFINACASAVDTLYKMLMQANVSNEQRGRAMGSWVLSIGTAPVGHMGVGALAGWLGAPAAILFNGSVLAFISLTSGIKFSDIRRL